MTEEEQIVSDYLIWVGASHYTEESFMNEAKSMGACRRVHGIPKNIKINESRIFLISDMPDAEALHKYHEELRFRDRERYRLTKDNEEVKGYKASVKGKMPRGDPVIFAWYTVQSIVYIVAPGVDIKQSLKDRGVLAYDYVDGGFGFSNERECGSLQIGGTYLMSEEDLEKVRDLADDSTLEGHITEMSPTLPYVGPRFRGIRAITQEQGDQLIEEGSEQ